MVRDINNRKETCLSTGTAYMRPKFGEFMVQKLLRMVGEYLATPNLKFSHRETAPALPGSTPGGGTLFRYVSNHPGRLSLLPLRGNVK